MSDLQGTFVWYELATTNVEAAIAFYGDVIGWGTEVFEGGMPYTIWKVGETGIGGVMALPEEAKKAGALPHWTSYVGADDVDALTKKAESLGATTHVPPQDIPTVGRFSIIADPHGARINLFKPSGPDSERPVEPTQGRFAWHELLAGDLESAFGFYSELFGWQKLEAVPMPTGVYQLYGKGGQTLGGMMTKPEGDPAPPHWLYYVGVDDLDGSIARVRKRGGSVMMGPMEVPGGERIAQCTDPQGAAFALVGK